MDINGVLKSWAIPKGNTADKRLAILIQDHLFSYKDFEGTIPEGNYGAGKFIVWDNGTYTLADEHGLNKVESKFKSDLQSGHLSFILNGKKLIGEFVLVKLKTKQENTWLSIKSKDQYGAIKIFYYKINP